MAHNLLIYALKVPRCRTIGFAELSASWRIGSGGSGVTSKNALQCSKKNLTVNLFPFCLSTRVALPPLNSQSIIPVRPRLKPKSNISLQAEPAFDSPAAAQPTAKRDLSISFYSLSPTGATPLVSVSGINSIVLL